MFNYSRFIEKYGTHIVVGVKMGGKDIVHIKQLHNSKLEPAELQKLLKELAEERFSADVNETSVSNSADLHGKMKVSSIANVNVTVFDIFFNVKYMDRKIHYLVLMRMKVETLLNDWIQEVF